MLRIFIFLIFYHGSLYSFNTNPASYIDNGINIFFPPSTNDIQYSQTSFQIFWWNFIVIDADPSGTPNWARAQNLCQQLQKYQNQELSFIICGSNELVQFKPLLREWAQDLVLRKPFPAAEAERQQWLKKSRQTLAHLSFVTDRQLLEIMQYDPFASWEEFLDLNKNNFESKFSKTNGYLVDLPTGRIVIPIQFAVPPQMSTTERFMSELPFGPDVHLIGNHQASYLNEKTVHDDLNQVSWVGTLCLLLLILFLIWQKRPIAIFLAIPASFGILGATIITIIYYGSIHGLSLAFGSAIAGLALDYALHGAFNSESKQTWKSNAVGLLTTLSGLGILFFCRIPLIEQMMFFSIWGILLGFISSYLVCEHLPQYFHLKGLELKIPRENSITTTLIVFCLLGWFLVFKVHFAFDLQRFNFQTKDQKEITEWFYKSEVSKPTYLFLKPLHESSLSEKTEWEWAIKNGAEYEGLLKYFPDSPTQNSNLQSWQNGACDFFQSHWSANEKKIYRPFLDFTCTLSSQLALFEQTNLTTRHYVKSYIGNSHSMSIIRTPNSETDVQFKIHFPHSKSIAETLKVFSESLSSDLKWMSPLSLFLSILILFIYYQRFQHVFTALLPFLTGVGCFFLVTTLLTESIDLISILGLLMVFGFSIDYGVFATDLYIKNSEALSQMNLLQLEKSVFSTLTLAALTNLVGFFPLVFAKHIVLHQLGYALFFGTLGTYLGTIWGVPYFLKPKESTSL